MKGDRKGLAIADQVASELRAGYDADALLGTLIPVLLALAVEYLGLPGTIERLEQILAEMRAEPGAYDA